MRCVRELLPTLSDLLHGSAIRHIRQRASGKRCRCRATRHRRYRRVLAVNTWDTISPAILDDDILSPTQIVNSPDPTAAPIMMGEEVKLEASPAVDLSSVQWNFDNTNEVGGYGLAGSPTASPTASPATLPGASPVAASANPTKMYWTAGDSVGWSQGGQPAAQHITLVAFAPNVQGPLVTDAYYPVAAPSPSVTTSPVPVALGSFPPADANGDYTCNTQVLAVGVGNPCANLYVSYHYGAAVPVYGAGYLTMVQVGLFYASGIQNGISFLDSSDPAYPHGGNDEDLDSTFPYEQAVQTGSLWNWGDAPAYAVGSGCTQAGLEGVYIDDYFLYQPKVPATRQGTPIWTTTYHQQWTFNVNATKGRSWALDKKSARNPLVSGGANSGMPSWPGLMLNQTSRCYP